MDAGDNGRELVRIGIISSTNPKKNTVRVTFPDKDNLVSGDLRIIHRGSIGNRDYWMPDVGEEVVCIFPTNDESYFDGYVIGTLFNDKEPPNANSQDVTRIDFKDGTSIEYDREKHALKVECKGTLEIKCDKDITITSAKNMILKGENIFINEG